MARRLATQLDAILDDAAMLVEIADLYLSPSQIGTMPPAAVEWHSSSGRVSKNSFFDVIEPSSEKNCRRLIDMRRLDHHSCAL